MTIPEVWSAVTSNAAKTLALGNTVCQLEAGFVADVTCTKL